MISATPDFVADWTAWLGLVAVAGAVFSAVIGAVVRWAFLPWLLDKIRDEVRDEVQEQTKELRTHNGGKHLPDVADKVDGLTSDLEQIKRALNIPPR